MAQNPFCAHLGSGSQAPAARRRKRNHCAVAAIGYAGKQNTNLPREYGIVKIQSPWQIGTSTVALEGLEGGGTGFEVGLLVDRKPNLKSECRS